MTIGAFVHSEVDQEASAPQFKKTCKNLSKLLEMISAINSRFGFRGLLG